jgi:ribosomal protein S12 methylthiotransferase accessory factor
MKDNLDISIQKLLNRANRLISSRVGVIKGIYPAFTQHFDPQTFSYGTEKTDTSKFFFHKAPEKGGAAGETWKSAYIASIGEAIERYCCALYDPGCLVFDSYLNLSEHTSAVHPRDFALFSETQYKKKDFPYLPFTESSQISWVKGFSLTKEHDIYVPAQTVFLPFTRQKKEMPICPITSTGLAAGPTLEFAALTALYEIIERDAFTITWLMRLPPKKVDVRNFSETYSFFKSRFVYNNFDYMFYDITLDINWVLVVVQEIPWAIL